MKKALIIAVTLILVFSLLIIAGDPPFFMPHVFLGTVTFSVEPETSLEGYNISAIFNGEGQGILGQVQTDNLYEVEVYTNNQGGEVVFYIGDVRAHPNATSGQFGEGRTTELDLIIDKLPTGQEFCGDGNIQPWEQCDGENIPELATCENLMGSGWTGNVTCSEECTYDTSGCIPPYCGDGECNGDETCSSCPGDCGGCSSGNGGSCFPAGTKILMKNGNEKNIEDVKIGDYVISYDEKTDTKVVGKVFELESPIRKHMCEIVFADNSRLRLTNEHPVYTKQGWKSIEPFETLLENSELGFVNKLNMGDEILFVDSDYKSIKDINCWNEIVQTYNLKEVEDYSNFYADNVLVHNKGGGNPPKKTNPPTSNNQVNLRFETDEKDETINVSSDKKQETSSGITGGVIGFVKSGIGVGLIFAILVVLVIIGIVGFRKKKSKLE